MMIRVILCSHNGERFLEAQLTSIMEQSRPIDMVHLFDFASSDGTRALLDRLVSRWPKLSVQLVDSAPGVILSFFHAFKLIVPICGDDDVLFLSDQDDVWLSDKVERMVSHLTEARRGTGESVLAFHDVIICDEILQPLQQGFYEGKPFRLPRDLAPERLLVANPVIGNTVAVTRPLLDLAIRCVRPSNYVMHDWALVLLAAHAGRITYLPERLSLYRQHQANILGAGRRKSVLAYIRRALHLSLALHVQAKAFIEDYGCIDKSAHATHRAMVLPGRGPLAWRLGLVMAWRGHTIWHRLSALLQARYLLRRGAITTDG